MVGWERGRVRTDASRGMGAWVGVASLVVGENQSVSQRIKGERRKSKSRPLTRSQVVDDDLSLNRSVQTANVAAKKFAVGWPYAWGIV